jgi:hypothetical protein
LTGVIVLLVSELLSATLKRFAFLELIAGDLVLPLLNGLMPICAESGSEAMMRGCQAEDDHVTRSDLPRE